MKTATLRGLLTLVVCCALVAPVMANSHFEQMLLEKNIQPTTDGLKAYFTSLHLDDAAQRRLVSKLVDQLGDVQYSVREAATSKLLSMRALPRARLIAASKGTDPEVRWRANRILSLANNEGDNVLYAALVTIAEKKLPGLTPELLRVIPLCDKPYLQASARRALAATARKADATLLRKALRSQNAQVRIAAIGAFSPAVGGKSAKQLHPLLKDDSDEVKLAAARAIADYGDRISLPVLLALLSSDSDKVRFGSGSTLRELTGQQFGFSGYEKPDERNKAVAKWKDWLAKSGRNAKLRIPLKPDGAGVSYLRGNMLLAFGYKNRVVEFDPSGREVWSFSVKAPWSAEKLANGNVLIAAFNGSRVVIVDRKGKIVWEYAARRPLNAKMLKNGNLLIALIEGLALEVTRDKRIVWKYKCGDCSDIHRLPNGNTLIASCGRGVLEVTPKGKIAWEIQTKTTRGCQPLPNGNVLITEYAGRVIEVTRDKKTVWTCPAKNPVDVFRLPNGNTLITGSDRFIEVTPDKKIVWTKTGANHGSARR